MGMLMHYTLMEMEKTKTNKREAKVEKPVENPVNEEPEAEPVKRTGGRRKATSK